MHRDFTIRWVCQEHSSHELQGFTVFLKMEDQRTKHHIL
jgi:hypothetical protein